MESSQIIIAGAGAAGLIAGRELSRKGYKVIILEGRGRTGGRIYSKFDTSMQHTVELGAEFIHGKLPVTLGLLKEYQIEKTPIEGRFFSIVNGEFQKNPDIVLDYHHELVSRLKKTETDSTVKEFLDLNFPEPRYQLLRQSVIRFTEGYETADSSKGSLLAFKEEWLGTESTQYRIKGGYGGLISAVEKECRENGCEILLNKIVKEITWSDQNVSVKTSDGNTYFSNKILITLPLGIWKEPFENTAGFKLHPELPFVREAINKIGYGSLIKFILGFNDTFWTTEGVRLWTGTDTAKTGFIFSSETVPTWWTQLPDKTPILTGWLGGPPSEKFSKSSEAELLQIAMESLRNIFGECPAPETSYIVNWNEDQFSAGSYSYKLPETDKVIDILNMPVNNTIYLAGEALHTTNSMATVESALTSGIAAADKIANS